jgi:hypothetical protein
LGGVLKCKIQKKGLDHEEDVLGYEWFSVKIERALLLPMSKRRVISYSKWEEVAKLSVKKDFFFRILVPMKRKGDARAPSSSSSARPNTPHTHKTHTHIDCEEIYCDRIFPHHHYNNHHAKWRSDGGKTITYENHSRSQFLTLIGRAAPAKAAKAKRVWAARSETFSQSTKSIRCDMTQVTWKSPKEGTTHYARPAHLYLPSSSPGFKRTPEASLLLFSQKYIIEGGRGLRR